MEDEYSEDFLAHFGVKGMRWGIRKNPKSSKTSLSSRIRTTRDRHIHPRETRQARAVRRDREYLRKLPVRYLTNEELKSRLSRAKMEKELRDIEHENTQKARKVVQDFAQKQGSKLVSEIFDVGMSSAKSYLNGDDNPMDTITRGVTKFYNRFNKGSEK